MRHRVRSSLLSSLFATGFAVPCNSWPRYNPHSWRCRARRFKGQGVNLFCTILENRVRLLENIGCLRAKNRYETTARTLLNW